MFISHSDIQYSAFPCITKVDGPGASTLQCNTPSILWQFSPLALSQFMLAVWQDLVRDQLWLHICIFCRTILSITMRYLMNSLTNEFSKTKIIDSSTLTWSLFQLAALHLGEKQQKTKLARVWRCTKLYFGVFEYLCLLCLATKENILNFPPTLEG